MKGRHDEGVANHIGPEPCVAVRKDVVRKKLGLTLQSDKTDGERVYRVIGNGNSAEASTSAQRQAA